MLASMLVVIVQKRFDEPTFQVRWCEAALGIPTLEDKIVQSAVAEVLSAIHEVDFLGLSCGFHRSEVRTWR